MASIVLNGDTSGSVTLSPPAVAGTNTITLPAATGTAVVTGTTPTLNGITFPATQVPSADANTLDDYEEGTFTPTATNLTTLTGSATWSGTYTKIGNTVIAQWNLTGGNFTVTANSTYMTLPFTVSKTGSATFILGSTTDGGFTQPNSGAARNYFASTKTATDFYGYVIYFTS
jgi:hypothetical protein